MHESEGSTLLSYMDIAVMEDRSLETVRRWRKAGLMPLPDDFVGNSPRWKHSTWTRWKRYGGVRIHHPDPTHIDRIEAAHWARDAGHHLLAYADAIGRIPGTYDHCVQDLDDVLGKLETIRRALQGHHSRGGTSILADVGDAPRDNAPDVRPAIERRPEQQ